MKSVEALIRSLAPVIEFDDGDILTIPKLAEIVKKLTRRIKSSELFLLQSEVVITDKDCAENLHFSSGKKYHREVITDSRYAELVMIGWDKKQASDVHDHGESQGVIKLFLGSLTELLYKRTINGDFRCIKTRPLEINQIVYEPRAYIHKIANKSGARAGSLHLYSPPLDRLKMNIYDKVSE
jgi:predicted metal-dependent enzyme (double-stranded beta helix superfamily)